MEVYAPRLAGLLFEVLVGGVLSAQVAYADADKALNMRLFSSSVAAISDAGGTVPFLVHSGDATLSICKNCARFKGTFNSRATASDNSPNDLRVLKPRPISELAMRVSSDMLSLNPRRRAARITVRVTGCASLAGVEVVGRLTETSVLTDAPDSVLTESTT